ncbi:nSTAND1 domain-containing NTPase [Nostoc sp.]|uniref:nSTAND1 domain-containing NTPase n=1 Tax=Nostoc sp. TaxID=1180 RepID=UPI002FFAFCF7
MTDSQQPENEKGLQQLAWAIESSVGQFKLILARCNYASLRDRLISRLREICQVEIRVLTVQQSNRTLYTAIQEELGEEIPACVMVVGLESVPNLSVMLTSANQVREEFRKNFAFPLVLWIDDEIYKQLIQFAPDLESWATTRNFAISTQELVDFIIETANQWFSNNLKFSLNVYIKLDNELEAAQRYLLDKPDVNNLEIQADLESLLGFIKQINNQKDLALQHYQKAYKLWQQSSNLERQAKILGEIGVGYYLKAFKNQDINHPDWQAAGYYVQEYINFINQFQSPDLIANTAIKFGDILRDLQKWETLQSLSEQALVVHQTNNQPRELAKDYGFLAEVALAQKDWVKANQLVQQALEVFAAIPNLESANISGVLAEIPKKVLKSKDLSLYQFILGRSQYHLGQIQQATLSLETARDVGNPLEDVRLYLDILRFLQQLYFEQKEYLKAYKIKQQQRSIEQQFGLRAFIGAGRLEATKQAFVETLRSNSPQGNIAPEIAASGRLLDIERLIERMGRPDYKLIVIHGQSGVGKSSLVNAGLIPALKNKAIGTQDYLPVVMRVYTNWVEELGRLLIRNKGNEGEQGSRGAGEQRGRRELELRSSTFELDESISELRSSTFELDESTSELRSSTFELDESTSELRSSTFELDESTSELRSSTFELDESISELRSSTFELDESISELRSSTSELRSSTFELDESTSELRSSTFELDESTSELRSSTSDTQNPQSQVPNPQSLITQLRENEQRNLRTVLIFDQFEEFFFVYTEPAQRKQFFEFLGECLNVLSVKVILSPQAGGSETREDKAFDISKLDLIVEIFVQSGLVVLLPENPADRYQLVHDYIAAFIRQQQEPKLKQVMAELEKEREQRKLGEVKFNRFLKRSIFGSVAAGLVVGVQVWVAFSLVGEANKLKKQAEINEINALTNSSETSFVSGQNPDALIKGLKAGGKLKLTPWANTDTQMRTMATLRQAVYLQPQEHKENKAFEVNTLEGHSSWVNSVGFSPDGKTLASGSDDKTVILWDLDFDNLSLSGCNLLNNYLIAHPEVLEELQSCQTPSQKALGATVLVIQGEKLARNDDINGAVEKFRQAQQWDNKLNFDFQARAREFVNKGKAEGSVDEGNSRLKEKKFKEALADYTEALKFDPKVEIPVDSWNTLCRQASLQEGNGMELMIFRLPVFIEPALQSLTSLSIYYYLQKQAADVLSACEKAVALAPKDGNIRDSRGLARALTGNIQGAIEDFEAYIAQSDDKDSKAQRQRWVKDLRAGKNPFTEAELKKLQN